ncbi:hypothetical protein ACIBL6_14140 [Streptomyces sp. NPDC050400]|uniref:hypothetical protein n=1 Tax=Streptomyces sp. NPDC050400 TaxID=3365610 RepID=UPI0037B753E7
MVERAPTFVYEPQVPRLRLGVTVTGAEVEHRWGGAWRDVVAVLRRQAVEAVTQYPDGQYD